MNPYISSSREELPESWSLSIYWDYTKFIVSESQLARMKFSLNTQSI